jgi:hypothetical protein
MPVVNSLLSAAAGIECRGRFGFLKKRFHLEPLDAGRQILLAEDTGFLPGRTNCGLKQQPLSHRKMAFFEAGDAVRQLVAANSDAHKLAAVTATLGSRFDRALQPVQLGNS